LVVPPGNINPVGGNASHVTWNFTWNSMSAADGAYTIWALSLDDSFPKIQSSWVQRNVTVNNGPPPVTIDPLQSPVSGKVTVTGSIAVAHAKRVIKVELRIIEADMNLPASFDVASGTWSATWDTTGTGNGEYTLKAVVEYDSHGTTEFSNAVKVRVDNPLAWWAIVLIVLLVLLLVIVVILVVIWFLDRKKIKALGLNPKDVKKENLIRRFLALIGRRGKVFFVLKFEGATALGSMHTIDMISIRKEKDKFLADILGKVSYRILEKDASVHVFMVNDWGSKKKHARRILFVSRKAMKKGGMRAASVEIYDTDQFAREKADWLEKARFRSEGEDARTGTRKRRFVLTIRKG
jgi:hypothetical protein